MRLLLCSILALTCLSTAVHAKDGQGLIVKASCEYQGMQDYSLRQCLALTQVKITQSAITQSIEARELTKGLEITTDFLIEAQNSDKNYKLVISIYTDAGVLVYTKQAGAYEYIHIDQFDIGFGRVGQNAPAKYEAVVTCAGPDPESTGLNPLTACFMDSEVVIEDQGSRKVYTYTDMPDKEFITPLPEHFYIAAQNSGSPWTNVIVKIYALDGGQRGELVYRKAVNNWDTIKAVH